MRRALLASALLLLAGCATRPEDSESALRFAGMIGKTEAELVRELGVPTNTYTSDGARFLRYDRPNTPGFSGVSPSVGLGLGFGSGGWRGGGVGFGMGFGGGFYDPPPLRARVCETTFEVREGRVRSFTIRGEGC